MRVICLEAVRELYDSGGGAREGNGMKGMSGSGQRWYGGVRRAVENSGK